MVHLSTRVLPRIGYNFGKKRYHNSRFVYYAMFLPYFSSHAPRREKKKTTLMAHPPSPLFPAFRRAT
jgi:hypothetical protein